ncbi:golgin subfamily A member 6-like protein 2 isoform X2 [Ruditapes philippinarum]|nr:golgin subfamily A member 6-like protein 2 isoform X2 [Ruditapes philippinarum]
MNKNLNEKIITLKKEINNQTEDFNAERMELIRSHRRETDNLKKVHNKTLERLSAKSQEITRQAEEINKLKATIESLEKTEKELREKIENAKKDGQNKIEYEKQMREMSASRKEIEKLREQIVILENTIAEKEKEISKEKEKNTDLSAEFGNLAQKQEHAMTVMKDELLNEIKERDKSTKDMLQQIQGLIVQGQSKQKDVEHNPKLRQGQSPLPPIRETTTSRQSGSDSKSKWKY